MMEGEVSKSREQMNRFLSKINLHGRTVLDVGVQNNPAKNYTKGVAKKYMTLDIDETWNPDLIMDINEDGINLSKITNLISLVEPLKGFDVVFCLEVLEHCWNPIQAVKNLFEFTEKGGYCFISVPFINPIHDKWDFLRYTPEWFEQVLPMVGFKDWKIEYRMAVGVKLKEFYDEEGMRMSKIRLEAGQGEMINLVGLFIIAHK